MPLAIQCCGDAATICPIWQFVRAIELTQSLSFALAWTYFRNLCIYLPSSGAMLVAEIGYSTRLNLAKASSLQNSLAFNLIAPNSIKLYTK
jgi:hypothetical protein